MNQPARHRISEKSHGPVAGVLPRQAIRALVQAGMIGAEGGIDDDQLQPASIDLRLGATAFRVRASFLPGRGRTVRDDLDMLAYDAIDLSHGAVLEKGCVYVVPLRESLALSDDLSGFANPKSSTGRLDVFTRLIADRSEVFDHVAGGYRGPLYCEISPRSFSIRVRAGSRLNQLRFRQRGPGQEERAVRLTDTELRALHDEAGLVDGDAQIRDGLILRVGLARADTPQIGYRAQQYTDIIDVDAVGACRVEDYWEPVRAQTGKGLILDPHQFYILASKEKVRIPPGYAAEMVPIDPSMGEFRVHYAGFFDPGFGHAEAAAPGSPPGSHAVLEVRSHEVPFILQDGQVIGRLVFERLTEPPEALYGATGTSHYQGQGLKLSKHFRT